MREGNLLNFTGAYRRILQEENTSGNPRGRHSSFSSSPIPLKDFDSRDARSTEDLPLVSGKPRGAFAHKWRTAVYISTIPVLLVLLVNLVATIWAAASFGTSEGLGTLYSGSCDVTAAWARWLHIFINILGSILLSCSNYAMQLLVSPTRREVDQAHSNKSWVDIGVPSVRNLRFISFKRVVLWSLLALSSIPLHLLYNSAVFQTLAAVQYYNVTVANEGFLEAAEWIPSPYIQNTSMADIVSLQRSLASGAARDPQIYQNLTNADCIRRYSAELKTDRKDIIAITSATNTANNSLFLQSAGFYFYAYTDDFTNGTEDYSGARMNKYTDMFLCSNFVTYCSFCSYHAPKCQMICSYKNPNCLRCSNETCSLNKNDLPGEVPDYVKCQVRNCDPSTARAEDWEIGGYPISYCLSQRIPEECELQFSQSILIVVIICNLIKAVCLFFCAKITSDQPLVTLGDAIASFLEVPDTVTTGLCLVQKNLFYGKRCPTQEPRSWRSQKRRWFNLVSKKRWALTISMCLVMLVIATILLSHGVNELSYEHDDVSLAALFRFGLGTVRGDSTVTGLGKNLSVTIAVLVANLPQVLVSFIYLFYNALFTCLLLGSEWASLSRQRKPLRVSLPQGEQRSTYWLQLPYRYAVPMIVAMTTLHWLISQSIFLVRINYYDEGKFSSVETSLGYSAIAIFFSIILGLLMVLACIASGFPKLQGDLPLAGSCSLAISAACHRPEDDVDAARLPVMWGEVEKEDQSADVGHCCITSKHVIPPTEGRLYAGWMEKDRGLCDKKTSSGIAG